MLSPFMSTPRFLGWFFIYLAAAQPFDTSPCAVAGPVGRLGKDVRPCTIRRSVLQKTFVVCSR